MFWYEVQCFCKNFGLHYLFVFQAFFFCVNLYDIFSENCRYVKLYSIGQKYYYRPIPTDAFVSF